MQRISKVNINNPTNEKVESLLNDVKSKMGGIPNIMATFARSESALEGYLSFSGALSKGKLAATVQEQIAISVAGENQCNYCASAHTALGKGAGVSASDLTLAIKGKSNDDKAQAALIFSRQLMESKGSISDTQLDAIRVAGYSDEEILEIVSHTALNIFTNYINLVAETENDFPLVDTKR